VSGWRSLLRTLPAWLLLAGPSVGFAQVSVSIGFAPAAFQSGGTSRLTITLGNTNPNGATAFLISTLTDTLPPGLTVANPAGIGGSCTAGAIGASAGGRSVSYGSDAPIPAGGCTIQVNVTGTSTTRNTSYTDSIAAGALQTTQGANAAAANATVAVYGATATVPNLAGMSQSAAATALQAAGYVLGTVTRATAPSTVAYNSVLRQVPAAGTVAAPGSAISITLSNGPHLATNPNQPFTSVPGYVQPYQQSEAAAIERVCALLASSDPSTLSAAQRNLSANCNAIIGSYGGGNNKAGFQEVLNALSGKQTTAQQRTGVQFSGAQFTNIGTRLAQLRQGVTGASFSGLDLGLPAGSDLGRLFAALEGASGSDPATTDSARAPGAPTGGGGGDPSSLSAMSRLGFFVNGSLRRGSQDTTTYETPFDYKANSITAGVDYRVTDRVIVGLAAGHSNGTTDFTDGTGRLDSRSNSVSLYGTYYQQALYIDVMGTFAHISYDADRTTSFSIESGTASGANNCAGTECSVDTSGATGARQLAFATNVGYSFNNGALTWGPDIALDYTHIHVDGFTENDPEQSGLALTYGDDIGESLLAKAGGHLSYAIKVPFGVILPEARAHYVHEFKNDQRALSVHFSADPDANAMSGPVSNFVVFTDPPNRSYYDYAAGVSAQFAFGISAFVDYDAVTSSDQRVHEVAFGVRFEHQVP
jgi:outer membrane lipase/esterase